MVDPTQISAGMLAASVIASVAQGASSAAGSSLVAWARETFRGRPELTKVTEVPDSPRLVGDLATVIDEAIADDQSLMDELHQLLEQTKAADPALVQNAAGRQNINANNSTVNVTFGQVQKDEVDLRVEWVKGDTFELINRGSATALNVEVSSHESMPLHLRDDLPDDLARGESVAFLVVRSLGTREQRITATWNTTDGSSDSRRLRVPPKP